MLYGNQKLSGKIAAMDTARALNTTHRGSDGTDHADVVTNTADILKYTLRTEIADPGDGVAIPVTASGIVKITTASSGGETNTVAIPTFEGQLLGIFCEVKGTGDRVITAASAINQAGNTIMTLGAVDDMIILIAIDKAGTLLWRVLQNDGAALS